MRISEETVEELDAYIDNNIDKITALVNDARDRLGDAFGEDVDKVTQEEVRDEFDAFLEDEDAALNVSALYRVGVELEVRNDYAGFVVDEMIGRRIAGTVAENDPEETLAEATFHYIDVHTNEVLDEEGRTAGEDDVLAGLAAGVQTRLPGWDWQEEGFS
ncbi:MAG: hypothetical protein U5J64_06925 [Halobacteriales archaeon]|nr:hypothetical protein [Halobacteriales archaeon]